MALPITSSVFTVHTEASGSLSGSGKYVRLGGGTIHRKFDTAIVPLLWSELWIGLLWMFDPAYNDFSGMSNWAIQRDTSGRNTAMITVGLYNSSGSFPNDDLSGSVEGSRFVSASVYAHTNLTANPVWLTSSLNNQYLGWAAYGGATINNVTTTTGGSQYQLLGAYNGNYKYSVFRFVRSPVATVATMSVQICGYDTGEMTNESTVTGSSKIADAFMFSDITPSIAVFGDNNSAGSVYNPVIYDSSVYGYLDSLFISWRSYHAPLKIAAVVVKATP